MIDPHMFELLYIQHIISPKRVCVDDGMGSDFLPDDRHKRCRGCIWDDHGMDIAIPFQEPEDGNLTRCATSPLSLAPAAKVALIHFDFAAHHGWFIAGDLVVDGLAKLVKKEGCSVTIHA